MPHRSSPVLIALLVAASGLGCTVARTRVKTDEDGWQTRTTYACDWSENGDYLQRADAPNSPILPVFRSRKRHFNILAIPFDLAFSPIAYLRGRDCWATDTERRYVGTPESRRKEREALALKKREDQALQLQSEAEDKRRRDEAERIAREYPPVEESPRRAPARPDDFALVVGVERYRSLPQADYGESDADLMTRAWRATRR
jgi:hypothetical protein